MIRDDTAGGAREDRLREIFPQLTPAQIGAARNYHLRYRDEIQRRIDENAALTAEGVVALLRERGLDATGGPRGRPGWP